MARGALAFALLALLACAPVAQAQSSDECAQCKQLLAAAQAKALEKAVWLEEQLTAACAAQPEDQRDQCLDMASQPSEKVQQFVAENPPAALCAQAGVCSATFFGQLAATLLEKPASPEQLCATCQSAADKALAALDDATTQATVRAYALSVCASLPTPDMATQCAQAVDDNLDAAFAAAQEFVADPHHACVALELCSCPHHGLDASMVLAEQAAFGFGALPGVRSSEDVLLVFEQEADSSNAYAWLPSFLSSSSSDLRDALSSSSSDWWTWISSSSSSEDEDGDVRFRTAGVLLKQPRPFGPLRY